LWEGGFGAMRQAIGEVFGVFRMLLGLGELW